MKKRLTQPHKNKYYQTKGSGGLSGCIQGYPAIAGTNVLCNCVGYANGRFNEIINDPDLKGTVKPFKYQLVCNAENFIESAKAQGLKISSVPKQGGIMVWQKGASLKESDGAGHVAVVEEILEDGRILTSESGYNAFAFKTLQRSNKNGRWGQAAGYKFRGCIVNPSVKEKKYKPKGPYKGTLPKGIVQKGSTGSDVKALQTFLNWYQNAGIDTDGIAGPKTIKALKIWEKQHDITPDGIFGPACLKKAQAIVRKYDPEKKSPYYNATAIIGQACCNEKGTLSGGIPGDQTGREVCMGSWSSSYDWIYVFRAKDKAKRLALAQAMIDTCQNQHIGYNIDKPERYAAWDAAEKNGHDIKGIRTNGDTTCSQAVSMCMRAIGIPKKYAPRFCDIAVLTKVMTNNNPYFVMYKSKAYTRSQAKLQPGDILLSSHHTAIVVKSPNIPEVKQK